MVVGPKDEFEDASDDERQEQGRSEQEEDQAQYEQPSSWEDFWRRTTAQHDEAMRNAGKDPYKPWEPADGKWGSKIAFGMPVDKQHRCFGCGTATTTRFECCQCLEIFRERAGRAAGDDWERAFYCSHECYKGDWEVHKDRHGPSKFGPSKMDSRIHEFDAAKGHGALWDAEELKRLNFVSCKPVW